MINFLKEILVCPFCTQIRYNRIIVTIAERKGKILVDTENEKWFNMQLLIINLLGLHICFELFNKGVLINIH